MRRLALAVTGLMLLLAIIPAVVAAHSSAPLPAAGDATVIDAVTPAALVAGVPTTLVATLRDTATSTPVGGVSLTFLEGTTFGWLVLGNATTNAQGEAGVTYEPVHNGTYTIVIAFGGDGTYAPTNTTLSLTVLAGPSSPPPSVPADLLIVLVIVAVVGGVWATYAFVGLQILGIRGIGSRPEDEEFESKELKKMEEEPTDAGASRKRVPGIANASRGVFALAAAALILSGAAIGLVALGGIGHTEAYTPSKVDLQVSVVPDFRGAAWDSFVPDELVVHVGDTVKVTVYNEDTMDHGFAIDAFGVNQVVPAATQDNVTGDITPSVTVITFTVNAAGAFLWYCTNPCGPGHVTMTGTLVVLSDD